MADYNFKEETRSEKVNGRVKRYKWYSIQAYLGKGADGKKNYQRFSGRDKNELLRQIAQAEAELKEAKEKAETITLGEALEEYIVSRTAVCSPSTIRGYRSLQRNALSELQNRPIDEISQIELQKFMNEYAKTHSPKTCRNVHGLLSSILQNNRPGFTIKTTLPQKELNDKERKANLKNAFQLSCNIVKYKQILLVDDIYTTGSTMDAVAEVLQSGENTRIYYICISIGNGF